MANKSLGGLTSVQVPEAEGSIPRTGQGKVTVAGDSNILHNVGMTTEAALRVTIALLARGQLPADDGLITRGGQDAVRDFVISGDGSNPTTVTLQVSTRNEFELSSKYGLKKLSTRLG